jgi:cyclopropane-fatty-acyl-phospholipid synthase
LKIFSQRSFASPDAAAVPAGLAVRLPQGQMLGPPDAPVRLMISAWSSLARLKAGQIGALAEDFVEGKLSLEGRMRDIMAVAADLLPGSPADMDSQTGAIARAWSAVKHLSRHTPQRDAAQVQFHYDVSDDFYALWLDPRRVYSCAYYSEPGMTLPKAQEAKLDLICRKLMLKPGERFLDIGAGWGSLLLWAAEHYGVNATGITLSRNQHAHVQGLIKARGLSDRVRMELMDYRSLDEREGFDKISSIGMFEHVGKAMLPAYFGTIRRLLVPGGLALNHGITAGATHNKQLGAGMGDFIEKYIFPGGELVHVSRVLAEMAEARMEVLDVENLRPHYARTLWDWSDALEARLDAARTVLTERSDNARAERVVRAYRLYLAGSAMSFEKGWIALHQVLASRPASDNGSVYPFRRDYMYQQAAA